MNNQFIAGVSANLRKQGLDSKVIRYVVGKLKYSFKTGVWVGEQKSQVK